ncbi:MAG TPA: IS3 family transposase [Kofleriaceae bacterium]|nr:IS3 family transposase [Kofleriaceae bacterium]
MSAFIDSHRERFGVEPICQTLDVSACAYYQRAMGERSDRSVEDERLTTRIREVHEQNFECYGYPRVWRELQRQGEQVGRDHVARLMRQEGIRGAKRRGKPWRTTIADPAAPKRPDLVDRDFTADRPDALWVGDFTYLRTWEGRMFFAFLIDVFSRMIVGWQLATHMRTDLVLDALRMALGLRQTGADVQLVAHTDQGSQYGAEDYTQVPDDYRVLASVGSVGDCYDNALAESFVDSYKTELIADRVWRTNARLELATVQYVGWFNHRRLHSSIENRPPIEHEHEYWQRIALGLEPGPAQTAPTVSDLRGVATVASSDRGGVGADRGDCTGLICEEGALEPLT